MSKVLAIMSMSLDVFVADRNDGTPAVPGNPTVISGVGVTHLRYTARKA